MSQVESAVQAGRAGGLFCACPAPDLGAAAADASDIRRLTAGFAFSAIAQTLSMTLLPLSGGKLAPTPTLAGAPFALTLLGAAFASIPASLLVDLFGRRAAFALGASLGTAGGLLGAAAILKGDFTLLCLAGLWIGVAQGFALFYRHAAAAAGGEGRGALTVLSGALAAGLVAPAVIALCQAQAGPFVDAALAVAAGLTSFAALPILLTLPHDIRPAAPAGEAPLRDRRFWLAGAAAAASWFAMAFVMTRAPMGLAGCGLGVGLIGTFISWHVVAMVAPIGFSARWSVAARTSLPLGLGLLTMALVGGRGGALSLEAGLIVAGLGWSFVQVAVARLLAAAAPSRFALGLHDCAILTAAMVGALAGA